MATNQFTQKCRYCGNVVEPNKGILISVWDGVDGIAWETSCKVCRASRKNAAQKSVQPTRESLAQKVSSQSKDVERLLTKRTTDVCRGCGANLKYTAAFENNVPVCDACGTRR